ncbi:hypothetical protein BMI91_00225 [Thioclava sediminum]|uniref:Uncharacterized protein n=1 Tax=Thioclava sediminum TaxID=1915319 RepID=A0ABX3MYX7_9RHOB|nr:hypothetical protein [Thioclava sediminum]OOY24911.1 hypothetical protein BMI91_00225 [Thioclava sediminum]
MKLCRILIGLFVLLWIAALLLLAIGTFGWFGQERDPLSGVFLMPLGLPWNMIVPVPESAAALWAVAAPGVNLVLLVIVCRALRRRH